MTTFDLAAVERRLERLDESALSGLVVDLWAARGYETTRNGATVVATRDRESVRIRAVAARRWRPATAGVDTGAADVVVAPAGGITTDRADVVDAAALAELLAYAVDRDTAAALCARHLGAPPDAVSPPLLVRTERWARQLARGSVPVLVLAAVVAATVVGATAGFGGVGSSDRAAVGDEPTPAVAASPSPTPPPPLPPADGSLPPGVTDDGIADVDTLANAHARTIGARSHTVWFDRTRPQDLEPNGPRVRKDVDIAASDGRYLVETTEQTAERDQYRGAVYHEEGVFYSADWNETAGRHEHILRLDSRNVLVPTPYELRDRLVERYLSTPSTNVTGTAELNGTPVHRVVGRGPPNTTALGEVRDYTVVALVDSRGFVRDVTVSYTSTFGSRAYAVSVEITYARVGSTTVERPAWFTERTRSEQDPSGANRPL
jgi:hypothetical protein